tara:strand:- start:267 stop:539 length:273 start_codon:yes stop_codon:yes gene_type:complete
MKTNLTKIQNLLGFSGGTIHQMSDLIGLSVDSILTIDKTPNMIDYRAKAVGSVSFTCSGKWLIDNKVPEYYGNYSYWHYAVKSLTLKAYI